MEKIKFIENDSSDILIQKNPLTSFAIAKSMRNRKLKKQTTVTSLLAETFTKIIGNSKRTQSLKRWFFFNKV